MDHLAVRRPCYAPEDDGLLSLADVQPCFSGNFTIPHHYPNSICHFSHRGGFRVRTYGSPRSIPGRSYDARCWFEDAGRRPHFLEACFLCKKLLGNNRDIFMYRGDTPFCSEECRQEQIDIDESTENKKKKINLSSSSTTMKALRKQQQQESTNRDYKSFHPGAIAAA